MSDSNETRLRRESLGDAIRDGPARNQPGRARIAYRTLSAVRVEPGSRQGRLPASN